ncbi:hypothetical protein AAHA92_28278 [Salvia divinorum]|uniref:Uncharacterized protein n=1 Tax=Salvia divinorum TaxID=28513 RepID=A0ABD1FUK5_SALDI
MARNWSSRYHSLWVVIFPIVVVLVLLLLVRSFYLSSLNHCYCPRYVLRDPWSKLAVVEAGSSIVVGFVTED